MHEVAERRAQKRRIFDQLTFFKVRGHIEIEKQIGQRRFHLSWADPAALERELEAFLEAQRRHISLAALLGQVAEGETAEQVRLPGPKGRIGFAEFCKQILPGYRSKMAGWRQEAGRIDWILANSSFARRPLHSIRPREISEFYRKYAHGPTVNSDNTRAHMAKALKTIFRTATEAGYLRDDPSSGLKRPGVPDSNQRALILPEAKRLVLSAEPLPRRWSLTVLYTGLRPVEITRLCVAHVDIPERRLRVVGRTAKNRSRDIYIHDEILEIMKECASAVPNLPLFRDASGRPEKFPRSAFERARDRANLHDVSLYTLRHTFATWLLETGTRDEETRAYILGHRLSRMSARYTHVTFEMVRDAIQRLPLVSTAGAPASAVGN